MFDKGFLSRMREEQVRRNFKQTRPTSSERSSVGQGKVREMKILFSLLSVLTVSLTLSAQQYRLPIGSNVNNHPARVGMIIGDVDENDWTGWAIEDDFDY